MAKGSKVYRARKAIEWYWTEGLTQEEIGDRLGVNRSTVTRYIQDPPEELKDAAESFKQSITTSTVDLLREQLAEATERARTAERPDKVFATDANGDLVTEEVVVDEMGNTETVPVVEDMELAPNHKVRAAARMEARQIIEMLWDLTSAQEPDEQKVEHSGSIFDLPEGVTEEWTRGNDE